MQLNKIALADTHSFSPFFLDYIEQKETLIPYFNRYPSLENFEGQMAEKSIAFSSNNREILATELQKQYEGLLPSKSVTENIFLLKEAKTYTVTTGHQLNIFTGPLILHFQNCYGNQHLQKT